MKKIIIVEDDTLLNKTLAYNFISDGYEVVSAYSYSMAVSLLKEVRGFKEIENHNTI